MPSKKEVDFDQSCDFIRFLVHDTCPEVKQAVDDFIKQMTALPQRTFFLSLGEALTTGDLKSLKNVTTGLLLGLSLANASDGTAIPKSGSVGDFLHTWKNRQGNVVDIQEALRRTRTRTKGSL